MWIAIPHIFMFHQTCRGTNTETLKRQRSIWEGDQELVKRSGRDESTWVVTYFYFLILVIFQGGCLRFCPGWLQSAVFTYPSHVIRITGGSHRTWPYDNHVIVDTTQVQKDQGAFPREMGSYCLVVDSQTR
jgi:hypothetical protein